MDLNVIRKDIDKVDKEIVELFEKRMELANEVAKYKSATGKPIYDKIRENQKLEELSDLASNEFNKRGVEELFSQIMSISRRYQYGVVGDKDKYIENKYACVDRLPINDKTRVAYQGIQGAYSEQAAIDYFGDNIEKKSVAEFKDIMTALIDDQVDYGVIPIENSSSGFVNGNYELLAKYNINVVDQVIVKVNQCLLGTKDANLESIKTVFSHQQGLLQSKKFLEKYNWEKIDYINTAVSAKKVSEEKDVSKAAIASKRAAEIYNLKVLAENINFESDNSTRFFIISKESIYKKNANRISIYFSLPHESGTLYNMLAHFIFNNLNMTSIESAPVPDEQWEYGFFVTFEGNLGDVEVINALKGINEEGANFKILGNYEEALNEGKRLQ